MIDDSALRTLVAETNPIPERDHVDDGEFAEVLFTIEQRWELNESVGSRVRWSKAAIVFAAAAALVLLLIGVPMLLSGDGASDVVEPATTMPVSTTLSPPTTSALPPTTIGRVTSTTEAAAAIAPVPDITWRRVDDAGAFVPTTDDFLLKSVTVVGPEIVLVGTGVRDPADEAAEERNVLWRSSDGGETWEEIDAGGFSDQEDWSGAGATTASRGTFVVAGSDADDAWVWTTTDFATWTKSDSLDLSGPGFQGIYGLGTLGERFIAVGEDEMDAAVWTSLDGVEWSQVQDEDLRAELIGDAWIRAVSPGGPGLIAVGSAGMSGGYGATDGGESENGAIWVSSGGLEWELLLVDDPGWDLGSVSVDPDSGRIIVFGGDRWVSDDGFEWVWFDRTVPLGGPPPGAGAAWIGDVVAAGGWDAAFSLWASGDAGITWHRVDPDHAEFEGCTQIADVVAFDDRFIAVGTTAETCWVEEGEVAVWIGTIND